MESSQRTASESGFESEDQRNWCYGLYHFQYRLVGTKDGGEISYHVEVRKRYDWGTPSEHRGDLEKSLAGCEVVDIEQADVAELNRVGLAQDFVVCGSTGEGTGRYWRRRADRQIPAVTTQSGGVGVRRVVWGSGRCAFDG
ncbi:hypothetical protein ABT127_16830 [Streptomyces sp. NPDC001904]|uniref:hypothetical protein n=1 Tax=Streptomyces sp. NPDC001904 TaxID=3154531 RepID=UPI0033175E4F